MSGSCQPARCATGGTAKTKPSAIMAIVVSYNEDAELLKHLLTLKNNKTKGNKLSKNSIKFLKNLEWNKVKIKYLKLLKF